MESSARIAVLAALATLLAGCAAMSPQQLPLAQPAPTTAPPSGDPDILAMQNRMLPTAEALQRLFDERYPDAFSQISLVQERGEIVVHRKAAPGLDEEIRRLDRPDDGVAIVVRDATYTQTELQALTLRIMETDREYWSARGVAVNSTGATPDGLQVGVETADLPAAVAAFTERYGPAVRVSAGGQAIPSGG